MGRIPRIHYSGAVYHAMARGVDGRDIFIDDLDRTVFVNALNHCAGDAAAVVLAYCLMGNHFHLAIKVGETPLSVIIQRLLTGYSMTFNRRHERTGHLFQARYKAIMCLENRYLTTLIHYIHLNPVRTGIVSRPQDWPWSSFTHREIRDDSEADLLGFDPWPKAADCKCELLRNDDGAHRDIAGIGADISLRTGVSIELMRSGNRRRFVIEAKRQLTHEAVRNGHALGVVAEWLRVAPSTITRYFGTRNE
ncbi:MAG: transposase [Elusimicrobiota bacterium]